MGDEDAAGFGIERRVIEFAVFTIRNLDDANLPQRLGRIRGTHGCEGCLAC
jgi:hypothetical protein